MAVMRIEDVGLNEQQLDCLGALLQLLRDEIKYRCDYNANNFYWLGYHDALFDLEADVAAEKSRDKMREND